MANSTESDLPPYIVSQGMRLLVDTAQIRTAADVYWHSINHLLKAGLKGSMAAGWIGLAPGEVPEERSKKRGHPDPSAERHPQAGRTHCESRNPESV